MAADVDTMELNNFTPIHIAAQEGYESLIRLLIEKDSLIDPLTSMKRTPLHLASMLGKVTCVKILIEVGKSKVNLSDDDQNTPLHLACERGHVECVIILLDKHADYLKKNALGMIPYDVC